MKAEPVVFLPAAVTREQLMDAGLAYKGVPYNSHRNYVYRRDGQIDVKKSSLNCYGFLLATARDCGLLPADFDLQRARWRHSQTLDDALWELLKTNFVRVRKARARPADVFLMWFRDVDKTTSGPHHVSIKSSSAPYWPRRGRMLHAVERDNSMAGAVIEQDIDVLEWRRVHSVWRLKGIHEADLAK
jgi:hypothetical protein